MWEFLLGMLLLTPVFAFAIFLRNESGDHLRNSFNAIRDRQKAIKGDYDKIDGDS